MATLLLNQRDDLLSLLEADLIARCQAALTAAGLTQIVHGVFSLDDLENKTAADLCQKIGVGVSYAGAEPVRRAGDPNTHGNVDRSPQARGVNFVFQVILAVPVNLNCDERTSATTLLTAFRRRIQGTRISGDSVNRTWAFAGEKPEIAESTAEMLFYAQLWRLTLINMGPDPLT